MDRLAPPPSTRRARARTPAWLQTAQGCDPQTMDECALFDDAPLAPAKEARPLAVMHVGAAPA